MRPPSAYDLPPPLLLSFAFTDRADEVDTDNRYTRREWSQLFPHIINRPSSVMTTLPAW
jgi:hypothetical protein